METNKVDIKEDWVKYYGHKYSINRADINTLLQFNATIIAGALIFLTVSSLSASNTTPNTTPNTTTAYTASDNTASRTASNITQHPPDYRIYLSFITAGVISPFMISSAFALIVTFAFHPNLGKRETYLHSAFNLTLYGLYFLPAFVTLVALFLFIGYLGEIVLSVLLGSIMVIAGVIVLTDRGKRVKLSDLTTTQNEIKLFLEMRGISKENIIVNTYDGIVEVEVKGWKYPIRIEMSPDTDIESGKCIYAETPRRTLFSQRKRRMLEITFKKKSQSQLHSLPIG